MFKDPEVPSQLVNLVATVASEPVAAPIAQLGDKLANRFRGSICGVLYYGSCRRDGVDPESVADLYVLVDSYRSAYRDSRLRGLLNWLLPPNVFYLEVAGEQGTYRAKYAVVSLRDFERGTSHAWFHSYLWGRFAQPASLFQAKDNETARRIQRSLARAAITFVQRTLPRAPAEFDTIQLWSNGLALSYGAELRTERQGRPAELARATLDYYTRITGAILDTMPYPIRKLPAGNWRAEIPPWRRTLSRATWVLRTLQGKVLSILRLVKALFTFEGGLDYIAWKLERHSGQKIEVSPQVRRFPLIFIWGMFWRLYRRGVFR